MKKKMIALIASLLLSGNIFGLMVIDNTDNPDYIRFYAHIDLYPNIELSVEPFLNGYAHEGPGCLAAGERMSITGTSGKINGQVVHISNPSNRCAFNFVIKVTQDKNGKLNAWLQ